MELVGRKAKPYTVRQGRGSCHLKPGSLGNDRNLETLGTRSPNNTRVSQPTILRLCDRATMIFPYTAAWSHNPQERYSCAANGRVQGSGRLANRREDFAHEQLMARLICKDARLCASRRRLPMLKEAAGRPRQAKRHLWLLHLLSDTSHCQNQDSLQHGKD
jgi:hypothetical protein